MMKKIKLFIAAIFVISNFAFADDLTDSTNNNSSVDETDWREFVSIMKIQRVPRIDVIYGFVNPNYHKDKFSSDFSMTNNAEVRLGFENVRNYRNSEQIFKYNHESFFIGNTREISSNKSQNDIENIQLEAWRFGFGGSSGYGYNLGAMKLALGNYNGINWTKFDFLDKPENLTDRRNLERIGDSFRFGTQTEANITFKFTDNIGISGSYQRAVVFPRHLFWYWAGSEIVRGIGSGLLDKFIKEVGKSSPAAIPVVSFVLENAFNYGFYELRQKNMNWPIDTEPPLAFDSFTIGLSFSF